MRTMNIYICDSIEEPTKRKENIIKSVRPDGTKANISLLKKFLEKNKIDINFIASPTLPRGVQVTVIWKYDNILTYSTNVNRWYTMVDT